MIFADFTLKEELLTIIPTKSRTRRINIYETFMSCVKKMIFLDKLTSIYTDRAPFMLVRHNGL